MVNIFSSTIAPASDMRSSETTQTGQVQPAMARMLGTARRGEEKVVHTVAGLPVAIGGTAGIHGLSGRTQLVRIPHAG